MQHFAQLTMAQFGYYAPEFDAFPIEKKVNWIVRRLKIDTSVLVSVSDSFRTSLCITAENCTQRHRDQKWYQTSSFFAVSLVPQFTT